MVLTVGKMGWFVNARLAHMQMTHYYKDVKHSLEI